MGKAKITIDGVEHELEEGMNLFEACEQANGEKLPHFCYHPGLSVVGVCRMCQVEVEGVPKLQIACNSTVRDGMSVNTKTPRVREAVRQILNFHLLHHPVDCPVCDQAGECSLQDFYMNNGLYDASIDVEDKIDKAKVKPIGEYVMLDAERCVLCARCTRFTDEITKTHELGIFNRGNHAEIDVAPGKTLDNNYSLNTVDICPVGALTSRDFRFQKRVWWLEETDSICPGCSTGCNISVHHEGGTAYRFKPRENRDVNDWWLCDHGRLLYKDLHTGDRLVGPVVVEDDGQEVCGFDHAWGRIADRWESLGEGRRLVLVGSPHATVEELYAMGSSLGRAAGGQLLGARLAGSHRGEGDELLLSPDRSPNMAGALRMGLGEYDAAALAAAASAGAMLVVVGDDVAGHDPVAAEAVGGFGAVVVISDRANATTELADVVLPGRAFAEKDGHWVNKDGRLQRLQKAFDGPGDSRDDLQLLRELAVLLGHEPSWEDREGLVAELIATGDAFAAMAQGVPPTGLPLDGSTATSDAGSGEGQS